MMNQKEKRALWAIVRILECTASRDMRRVAKLKPKDPRFATKERNAAIASLSGSALALKWAASLIRSRLMKLGAFDPRILEARSAARILKNRSKR